MRYFIFIMLIALLFVGCEDPAQTHTNVVSCTQDNDCEGNTNGKVLCIDDKCTEPAQVEDCNTDDDCKDNTMNTKCVESKCVKADIVNCNTDNNCKDNSNGKTICKDNKCTEPPQVEDCSSDNDCKDNIINTICKDNKCAKPKTNISDCTDDVHCENNNNGKTVCNTAIAKCSEPNTVDCTDGGDECADNFDGKIICNELKCVKPNAVDCTDGGDECVDNFNGKVVCNTITLKCSEPNAVDCTDGGDECIENFDGNTVCDIETGKCVHIDTIDCTDGGDECAQNRDGKTKCSTLGVCIDPTCVPTDEVCNGLDDNCDGLIDNGDLCSGYTNGIGQCTSQEDGSAICTLISCNEGFYNNDSDETNGCEYSCTPIVGGDELCNGVDDNCDGQADEGFNLQEDPNNCGTCNNLCGTYTNAATACVAGQCQMGACDEGSYDKNNDDSDGCEYACNYIGEDDSDCDGLDNDCDGTADEDADLTAIENCGACGNNCIDTIPDELDRATLRISCDGSCQYSCRTNHYNINNDWSDGCEYECSPSNGGVEKCDGLDDDCNGLTDDGITCNCTDGVSSECTVPNTQCIHGTRTCNDGDWGICQDNIYNHAETCDALDNDCDGYVDEDFMNDARTIYTDDNNCSECGKVCEDVHSDNSCIKTGASAGTCKPICTSGWTNFNENNFDGCETGCTTHNFNEKSYLRVAGGTSGNDVEGMASIYADGKLAFTYRKVSNPSNLYVKVVDKSGNQLMAEKALTDLDANKRVDLTSIVKVGNKYHIAFTSNSDGNYEVYHRVYDEEFNSVTSRINVSDGTDNANDPFLAKDDYLANSSNKLPLVWYEYNAGKPNVHYRTINTSTNTLNNDEMTITTDSKYPKVATTSRYIGITACHKQSDGSSSLYYYRYNVSNTHYTNANKLTDFPNNDSCNWQHASITSDGTYFYIAFIADNGNQYIQKFFGDNKKADYHTTSVGTNSKYRKIYISYNLGNVVIAYDYYDASRSHYLLSTKRFNTSLEYKNINANLRDLSSPYKNKSVYFTEDNKVLTIYGTDATSTASDIEISVTDTCGN